MCLSAFTIVLVEGYCKMALFRYLSKRLFGTPKFRKYISYEGQLLFENFQNLMQISKLKKKIQKNFFYLESLDLNWLRKTFSIPQRILVIGSECVNKQP